ncbi:carbohydrate-binding module family 20 domain-containing protein [Streptomyces sp. NPDC032472]|uniref:carbohydrate-binding module family 20 domain-containing protein n=1 Tax=Streptomyces sp. NPDC032472 TaxID=3155018 RepID=UPI00340822CD
MQGPGRRRATVSAAAALAAALLSGASPSAAADVPASAPIHFQVTAGTEWGDQVFAVGSTPALGSWDPARAVPLDARGYPTWAADGVVASGSPVEYKYLVKKADGTITWEEGANRLLRPWADAPVTTRDTFRLTAATPASGIAPTCAGWSETWRYTSVFNGCGSPYTLQVLYRDGSASICREVAPAATATFPGYGPYENHPVAVNHC